MKPGSKCCAKPVGSCCKTVRKKCGAKFCTERTRVKGWETVTAEPQIACQKGGCRTGKGFVPATSEECGGETCTKGKTCCKKEKTCCKKEVMHCKPACEAPWEPVGDDMGEEVDEEDEEDDEEEEGEGDDEDGEEPEEGEPGPLEPEEEPVETGE